MNLLMNLFINMSAIVLIIYTAFCLDWAFISHT